VRYTVRDSFILVTLLLLGFGLFKVNIVSAGESNNVKDVPAESIVFRATPKRCVLKHNSSICRTEIKLAWSAGSLASYCISRSSIDEAIKCWHNSIEGSISYLFISRKDITFRLINSDSGQVVHELTVPVVSLSDHPPRLNMRRRRLWSFP
jgi:hypothetical protein